MRGRPLLLVALALLAAAAVAWQLGRARAPAAGGDDVPAGEASAERSSAAGLRVNPAAATPKGPLAALLPEDAQPRPFSRGPLRVCVTVEDEPRAGVTVRLRGVDDLQPTATAQTDAHGIAQFGAVDRSKVVAEVLLDGFRPASTAAQGFEEDEDGVVTLALEPGIRVEGRVVDADGGAGLPGARVVARLSALPFEIGPTDAAGRFVLPGLAEDAIAEFVASAPGRATVATSVTVKEGLVVPSVLVLRLARGTALVGVARSSDGAPVAGAEVTVAVVAVGAPTPPPDPEKTSDGRPYADSIDRFQWGDDREAAAPAEGEGFRATSSERGAFRIEGLGFGGTYDVWLRHPESVTARKVLRVQAPSAGDTGPLMLVARRPATVRLTVRTPPNRTVASDARVRLFYGPSSSAPDASPAPGEFEFLEVVPGPVAAYVRAPGLRPAAVRGTAAEGDTLELALTLEPKETIAGVVVDEGGRPLSGAQVEIGAPDPRLPTPSTKIALMGSAITDEEGRFEFWDPPDGATVLVAHWGESPTVFRTREQLAVRPPAVGLRVVLFRRGSIRLRLVTPQGETFDGPAWAAFGVEPGPTHRVVAREGVLEQNDLDDGEYDVLVVPPGWAWMRRVATVRGGAAVDWGDVVLDPGVPVAGRVLDTAGRPVEGARIRPAFFWGPVHDEVYLSSDRFASTDAEGRFRLEHVPRGETVELGVSATGYTDESIQAVAGAAAPLEVRLKREALLQGEVHGPDGIDVRTALIELRPAAGRVVREDDGEYVEGSQSLDVGEGGHFAVWLPPGKWIAVWIDDAQVAHPLGEWTLTAGADTDVVLRLPER